MPINAPSTKKVFVLYVKDNCNEINKICDEFRSNNIEYWLDRDDIVPGKIWEKAIKDAIKNGAYFLACFSREYEKRNETYMNEEILVDIEVLRSKPHNSGWMIPIKLSKCDIPDIDIGAGNSLQDI
ncbi:MAG: TIR domain-containing protein [ANME-2 cluster archaeon]|nr:MAG: TIR domain-containing protein [ANME-2 cluster archaeon]